MFTVFLVDDDAGVLTALARLLRVRGYDVRTYTSPLDFLTGHDASVPGCAVLDVAMPSLDGLQLQRALAAGGAQRPIIFVTGKGDIPTSVRAMKANCGLLTTVGAPQRRTCRCRASRSNSWPAASELAIGFSLQMCLPAPIA